MMFTNNQEIRNNIFWVVFGPFKICFSEQKIIVQTHRRNKHTKKLPQKCIDRYSDYVEI